MAGGTKMWIILRRTFQPWNLVLSRKGQPSSKPNFHELSKCTLKKDDFCLQNELTRLFLCSDPPQLVKMHPLAHLGTVEWVLLTIVDNVKAHKGSEKLGGFPSLSAPYIGHGFWICYRNLIIWLLWRKIFTRYSFQSRFQDEEAVNSRQ